MSKFISPLFTFYFLFFLPFTLYPTPYLYSQEIPVSNYEAEVASRLRDDISKLLDELIGKGKSRVFITIEGEMVLKTKTEVGTPTEDLITLPGYPSVNILEKTAEYLQKQKQESERTSQFRIKRTHVSIIIDKSVAEAKGNTIKLLVSDVLRLSEQKGDSITLIRTDMLPWWKTLVGSPDNHRILMLSSIAILAIIMIAILMYFLVSKLLKNAFDYAKANQSSPIMSAGVPGQQIPVEGGTAEEETGEVFDVEADPSAGGGRFLIESTTQFDFIEKFSIEDLIEILHDEPLENTAMLIALLTDKKPHISSRLLIALPLDKRQEITKQMVSIREIEPEKLVEIEQRLRDKIEKFLKGTDKLGKILSIIDSEERDQIITGLSVTSPESFEKIRQSLITFEDICKLRADNLRPIVVGIPYKDWAVALQGMPEDAIGNVLNILPEDVRIITKDLMLTRQEQAKVIKARAQIIWKAMDLNAKGKITLQA